MNTFSINLLLSLLLTLLMTGIGYAQNLEINLCDADNDGYATFDIGELESYVLQSVGQENDYLLEEILISSSNGTILSVNSPSDNPSISILCELDSYLTDIAVNSNQVIFLCGAGNISKIDDDCNRHYYNYSYFQSNALSFDDFDNLYIGQGTESYVLRNNISPEGVFSGVIWHDFEIGASGGDFVLLNDKIYVSWRLPNSEYRLYEVTVDANRDYISHIDLGQLPDETFGLASELGKLYGVTPQNLFEINLSNFTFSTIIQNPDPLDEWYGAAGLHEAIVFTTSTHLTLNDAENGINGISGDWTNTGQTVYIRIEDSSTGDFDIFLLDINMSSYPNVNQPLDLEMCYSDAYNIFDLTQVSTQMQIDAADNLSFTYYDVDPEINNDTNPISTQYQSTTPTEILFVNINTNNSDCGLIYSFQIINSENPSLLPLSNMQTPTLLESCFYDENDVGYFNLKDIEVDMILEDGKFETSYYLSYLDAENNSNQVSYIYYLETAIQEIFIKVIDEQGCYTISNFYLQSDCYTNNVTLKGIIFPKFITPNNDGIHDFWNIKGVSEKVKKESTVTIFDRYGKELASFRPYWSVGWDGTYKGQKLPASDYWFVFKTNSGSKKLGHFALKR